MKYFKIKKVIKIITIVLMQMETYRFEIILSITKLTNYVLIYPATLSNCYKIMSTSNIIAVKLHNLLLLYIL
jgi:hypothetical protein